MPSASYRKRRDEKRLDRDSDERTLEAHAVVVGGTAQGDARRRVAVEGDDTTGRAGSSASGHVVRRFGNDHASWRPVTGATDALGTSRAPLFAGSAVVRSHQGRTSASEEGRKGDSSAGSCGTARAP